MTGALVAPLFIMKALDKDTLRLALPLDHVCDVLGIQLDEAGKARCPWHDDSRPSFDIYVGHTGVERFACAPCGISGDVYDLLQRAEGLTFPESLNRAEEILDEMPERAAPRTTRRLHAFDAPTAAILLEEAQNIIRANPGWLAPFLGMRETPDADTDDKILHLTQIGVDGEGNVLFPHFDYEGRLTGIKFRALDRRRWSFPGSRFECLYGAWHTRKSRDVLILEGETDWIWCALQEQVLVDCIGLPSGAGKFIDAWKALEFDTMYLAFDGDPAGEEATVKWLKEFAGRNVKVCPIPQYEDVRSMKGKVSDLLAEASLIG